MLGFQEADISVILPIGQKSIMEQESKISEFLPNPRQNLIGTSAFFSTLTEHESPSFKDSHLFQTTAAISAKLHCLLSLLTKRETYTVSRLPFRPREHLERVVRVLIQHKIIHSINFNAYRYNDAPQFYRCAIQASDKENLTDGLINVAVGGYATGRELNEVTSKAIGELLERYFLAIYFGKDLLQESPLSLAERRISFIHPAEIEIFSEEQKMIYPKRRWDEASDFCWEKIERISTGKTCYVPASLVYWNCQQEISEPELRERNTNGAGGMFTKEGAILAGLYELIQRDAFLLYWLKNTPPPRVDPESVSHPEFQNLYQESIRYGFKIQCLDITSDIAIPTFAVAIIDPSGHAPYLSLGAATAPQPGKALLAALLEAWAVYLSLCMQESIELPDDFKPFCDATFGRSERLHLWANPKMQSKSRFFTEGPMRTLEASAFAYPRQFNSTKEELDTAIQLVERRGRGYEVYAHAVHHPLLSRLGYHVAKVIVPKLIPLYLTESNTPLGAPRLLESPPPMKNRGQQLNPLPHPFP